MFIVGLIGVLLFMRLALLVMRGRTKLEEILPQVFLIGVGLIFGCILLNMLLQAVPHTWSISWLLLAILIAAAVLVFLIPRGVRHRVLAHLIYDVFIFAVKLPFRLIAGPFVFLFKPRPPRRAEQVSNNLPPHWIERPRNARR